jgi:hypothetical protein
VDAEARTNINNEEVLDAHIPTAFTPTAPLSALLILGVFFRNAADIHIRD